MSWTSANLVSANDYLNTIIGKGTDYASVLSGLANRLIGRSLYYRNIPYKDMALIKNPYKRRYADNLDLMTYNKIGEKVNINEDNGRQIVFLDDVGGLYGYTHEDGYKQKSENTRLVSNMEKVNTFFNGDVNRLVSSNIYNNNSNYQQINNGNLSISSDSLGKILHPYRKFVKEGERDIIINSYYDYAFREKNDKTFEKTYNSTHLLYDENSELDITKPNLLDKNDNIFNNLIFDTDSILYKTNTLYKENQIKTLVNRFYLNDDTEGSLIQSAIDRQYGVSRGRNLRKKKTSKANGYKNPYCRVWTSHHQYAKFKDVIRPFVFEDEDGSIGVRSIKDIQSQYGAMRPKDGAKRLQENSVFNENGMVRIAPTIGNTNKNDRFNVGDITKCMFSIENLAWKDYNGLKDSQRGPHGGRIMWFPPYGLKFTENVQPQWDGHSFIGRGEKIYTYVNTERSGTLNFTLLVDHPSIINQWRRGLGEGEPENRHEKEQDILRFFAGCDNLEINDKVNVEVKKNIVTYIEPTEPVEEKEPIIYRVIAFYPNNYSGIDMLKDENGYFESIFSALYDAYEVEETGIIGKDGRYWPSDSDLPVYKPWQYDTYSYMLNKKEGLTKYESLIREKLGLGENDKMFCLSDMFDSEELGSKNITNLLLDYNLNIYTQGYASSHGYKESNNKLSTRRASFLGQWAKEFFGAKTFEIKKTKIIDVDKGDASENRSAIGAKIGRSAVLTLEFTPKEVAKPNNNIETITVVNNGDNIPEGVKIVSNNVVTQIEEMALNNLDYNHEYEYFKELKTTDHLLYTNLIDKIKYFNPAFHSITPEGFNARLTFLHQCTRQGPTNAASDNNSMSTYGAGNLSFGRAPYCILRIGDFYHTKIMIDSLSINYDTNQWDLNPEGIGVQPMLAEININFKFVGGSDLSGPIERLQNAVSSNYYANASVYDDVADTNLSENEKRKYFKNTEEMIKSVKNSVETANKNIQERVDRLRNY